jgi:hypothetical protein
VWKIYYEDQRHFQDYSHILYMSIPLNKKSKETTII